MASNSADQVSKLAERASAGIDVMAERAKGLTQTAATAAQDAASALAEARDTAWTTARKASVQTRDVADELAKRVQQQPIAALLIAGAVGYALALLLHSRR